MPSSLRSRNRWGIAHRLELLEQLAQGERSVEILANRTGLSIANASQHLQHMRRAGLVATRREGKFIYYTLADDGILDVLAALRRIAERNIAEVERVVRSYFNKLDDLEPVTRKQLLKMIREGGGHRVGRASSQMSLPWDMYRAL